MPRITTEIESEPLTPPGTPPRPDSTVATPPPLPPRSANPPAPARPPRRRVLLPTPRAPPRAPIEPVAGPSGLQRERTIANQNQRSQHNRDKEEKKRAARLGALGDVEKGKAQKAKGIRDWRSALHQFTKAQKELEKAHVLRRVTAAWDLQPDSFQNEWKKKRDKAVRNGVLAQFKILNGQRLIEGKYPRHFDYNEYERIVIGKFAHEAKQELNFPLHLK